jgi:hypothetical protein
MLVNVSESMVPFLSYSAIYDFFAWQFGSTQFIDIIYLVVSSLAPIGLCLNLIGIRILFNRSFKNAKIYDYMKVYMIISSVSCMSLIPAFVFARRFFYGHEIYGTFYALYLFSSRRLLTHQM